MILPLSAAVALLSTLSAPTLAFRAASFSGIASIRHNSADADRQNQHRRVSAALRLSDNEQWNEEEGGYYEVPNANSREQDMMDRALREQQFRQGISQNGSGLPPSGDATGRKRLDPLIASLTRIDEPTPDNVPMVQAPLLGEIPADGNLALLVPAAAISILGFIFSIVVAVNSKDSIVEEFSKVELPKMEYTPTVVEEGKCRGLCSSQDEDLDGLRTYMQKISGKNN